MNEKHERKAREVETGNNDEPLNHEIGLERCQNMGGPSTRRVKRNKGSRKESSATEGEAKR